MGCRSVSNESLNDVSVVFGLLNLDMFFLLRHCHYCTMGWNSFWRFIQIFTIWTVKSVPRLLVSVHCKAVVRQRGKFPKKSWDAWDFFMKKRTVNLKKNHEILALLIQKKNAPSKLTSTHLSNVVGTISTSWLSRCIAVFRWGSRSHE